MKLEFSRQIFEKVSNIKFHQNPSSGSRVVPCGRTDMTKLIVAFRNFANAPKKESQPAGCITSSGRCYERESKYTRTCVRPRDVSEDLLFEFPSNFFRCLRLLKCLSALINLHPHRYGFPLPGNGNNNANHLSLYLRAHKQQVPFVLPEH